MRPVSFAALLAFVLVSSTAFATDAERYFESDDFHFVQPDDVSVTVDTIRAEQGSVQVVTVRLTEPASGGTIGSSFIAFTVYSEPLSLPEGVSQTDGARDRTVDGIASAFRGAAVIRPTQHGVAIGGAEVEGRTFPISAGGEQARATVAAVGFGDGAIVYYDHRSPADSARFDDFDSIRRTFAVGEAPESDEGEEPAVGDDDGEEPAESPEDGDAPSAEAAEEG